MMNRRMSTHTQEPGFGGFTAGYFSSPLETLPGGRLPLPDIPRSGPPTPEATALAVRHAKRYPAEEVMEEGLSPSGMSRSQMERVAEQHAKTHVEEEVVEEARGGGEHHGFQCQHCSFQARTAHGFGRHLRTHGFGIMGRHFHR